MSLASVQPGRVVQIDPVPRISIQAFCESVEASAVVAEAAADRRMAKAQVKQTMGGAAAALEAYRNAATPNVIVLEAPTDRVPADRPARRARPALRPGNQGRRARPRRTTSRSIVSSSRAGSANISSRRSRWWTSCRRSRSSSARPGAKPLGRVVAVVGAKGGVGASTVAHNLAWSLASVADKATIIADFDLAFGTAGLDYNQDPPQSVADAVFAPERVDAVLVDRLLAKCGDNLSLLAAPATLDRTLDFSETAFDTLIDAMRASTPWIVVDLPHLWSGWARRTSIAADDVVAGRQPRPRQSAQRQEPRRRAQGRAAERPSAAPGAQRRRHGAAAGDRRRRSSPRPWRSKPVAVIPHDAKLFGAAANNGQMIAEIEPKGKIAQTFDELAWRSPDGPSRRDRRRGLLEPLMAALAWVRG